MLKAAVDRNKTRIKELLSQLRQTIGSYASSSQLLPNSSTIISDSTFETNADELKTKRAARRICEGKIQNVQSRAELTTLLQEKNNLDLEIADLKHTAHTILSKQAIRTFTEKATPLLESIELLLTEPNPSEQQIAKLNTLILDAGVLLETLKACQIAHASTKTELTLKKATSNNLIATIDAYLEISSPENLSRVYSALQEKTEISNVKELMERTTGTAFAVGMLNFSATPLEDALRGHLTAIRDNEIQLINRANNGYSDGAEGSVGALHWMLDRHTESITSFETLIRNANATISRIETKKENDTKHYQAILATGEADKALRSSQKNSEIVTEIFTQIESQLNQLLRSATPSNVRWMNFLNAVAEDALANAIPEDQWANLVFNRLDNQFHMLQFPGFKERLTNNINASLRALNSNPTTGVNSEPFTIQLPDVSAPVRSPSPNLDDANLALKAMDELGRTYPSSSSSQVGKENSEKATPSSSNRDAYLSSQPNAVIFQFIEGSRNQLVALAKSSTKDAETTRLKIERRIRAAEAELELRRSESA